MHSGYRFGNQDPERDDGGLAPLDAALDEHGEPNQTAAREIASIRRTISSALRRLLKPEMRT